MCSCIVYFKALRGDYEGTQALLKTLKQLKMRPNVMTYGVLALSCQTGEQAHSLLNEMRTVGYT